MSILHLVRKSAYQSDDLAQCLQLFATQDAIVLLDDGCYNLNHTLLAEITNKQLFVISEHCQARAVVLAKNQQSIALAQLAPLLFLYDSVMTWQ
jgi:tRNA 2-thiouridine synthesizing protein B